MTTETLDKVEETTLAHHTIPAGYLIVGKEVVNTHYIERVHPTMWTIDGRRTVISLRSGATVSAAVEQGQVLTAIDDSRSRYCYTVPPVKDDEHAIAIVGQLWNQEPAS